jgi:hypothetical protein
MRCLADIYLADPLLGRRTTAAGGPLGRNVFTQQNTAHVNYFRENLQTAP